MSETIIYTTSTCPYCVRAKEILREQGVSYREVLKGQPGFETKEQLQESIGTVVNTVPQIVLNGTYIGGCDKLAAHFGVEIFPKKA